MSHENPDHNMILGKYQGQLLEDDLTPKISVVAKVRGYYLAVATRFVDVMSICFNSRFPRSLRDEIQGC
ncbi:hypothetical protein F4823DRAFT_595220 [Ustulina deusta]|nr:hypothetical protein F4823DRAFT_595220 [Ustulina deusta]